MVYFLKLSEFTGEEFIPHSQGYMIKEKRKRKKQTVKQE